MKLRLARYIWIGLSLAVLLASLYITFFPLKGADNPLEGAVLVVYYGMAGLTFPAGILGMVAHNLIAVFFWGEPSSFVGVMSLWASMFLAGYIQWFYFLPEIWKRIRATRGKSTR